jgi:hypothetical protein
MTYEERVLAETISKLEDHLLPNYGDKFDPESRKVVKRMLKKLYDSAFNKGKQWIERTRKD